MPVMDGIRDMTRDGIMDMTRGWNMEVTMGVNRTMDRVIIRVDKTNLISADFLPENTEQGIRCVYKCP